MNIVRRESTACLEADKNILDANIQSRAEILGFPPGSTFRLPSALEGNLIFNRFAIANDSREWTTDVHHGTLGGNRRIVMGEWSHGGAADISSEPPQNEYSSSGGHTRLGYRVLIQFPQ